MNKITKNIEKENERSSDLFFRFPLKKYIINIIILNCTLMIKIPRLGGGIYVRADLSVMNILGYCDWLCPNRFTYLHMLSANQLHDYCRCTRCLSFDLDFIADPGQGHKTL